MNILLILLAILLLTGGIGYFGGPSYGGYGYGPGIGIGGLLVVVLVILLLTGRL